MAEPALILENVDKSFGVFKAVNDLTFSIARGEIFGFLGPNGAGKTTTLRMILDIFAPTAGRILVLGSPSAIPVRHRIGYLPEERGLYRKMRAAETIAYFASLRGLDRKTAKNKAHELLERFGLGEHARTKNEALSKGMAQKVQLLATIAHDPELLILDEPFSGLDPINQATLEALIAELRAQGKTIVFSTHTMQHAERLCDRFLIIANGTNRFLGTLGQARRNFPPRLLICTPDAITPLEKFTGVKAIIPTETHDDDARAYSVELAPGADPNDILRAAFDAGLRISRFENTVASLHDIFVAVAGGDGVEKTQAEAA